MISNIVMISITVDPNSEVPIYVQVKNQYRLAIDQGEILAGQQLPTVRDLAIQLAVNPNTVQRVYSDLERDGYIKRMRGIGTFAVDPREGRSREMPGRAAFSETIRQLRQLGYSGRQIIELAGEILDESNH